MFGVCALDCEFLLALVRDSPMGLLAEQSCYGAHADAHQSRRRLLLVVHALVILVCEIGDGDPLKGDALTDERSPQLKWVVAVVCRLVHLTIK